MTELPNVTLIVADCSQYGNAIASIKKSLTKIKPAKSIFFSDIEAYSKSFPFELIKIGKLSSKRDYSAFIIKRLDEYISTDFVLVTQHDGWVLDDTAWSDEFFKYDYIGAPWLESDGYNVGNGGFSLRSKKLQHILATDDFIQINHSAEDVIICRLYRDYLEQQYDIKFAPEDVAERFSFELREPSKPTFGFHGKFHKPYRPTVIVKRTGALGDIIATEPLLERLNNDGYMVAIDMPIYLCAPLGEHFYDIRHISQLDGRVRDNARIIDLDMSYENNPKQLHLKTYYEAAGITDGEIKNPRLKFNIDAHNRLFKKYCVIHIDERDQPSRNVNGVHWDDVAEHLKEKGFLVIQVGQRMREEIEGAVYLNTSITRMLQYAIAGASLFIGVDSGPAAIAVAMNIPSVIFFGSVNPEYIHPDLSNIEIVSKGKVCDTPRCWHDVVGGIEGKPCYVDEENPPCSQFTTEETLSAIKKILSH